MHIKKIILLFISIFIGLNCYAVSEVEMETKEKVILIHGFARNNMSMWKLASSIEKAGYEVERVGYKSLRKNIDEIKKIVFKQFDKNIDSKYEKVHFVGHSLGGLLIRSYLGNHNVKNLGNVVLIGSPSHGTEAVDYYKDKKWFKLTGPIAVELGTNGSKFLESLTQPYYNLGVIAGNKEIKLFEHVLKGQDDGLVRVESTKIKGMSDFIIIKANHAGMRFNKNVAHQTISFLKNGKFKK